MKEDMKKIILVFSVMFFSFSGFTQNSNIDNKTKIEEIDNYVKFIDSISIDKKEGIVEGVINYSHGKKRTFGWDAYYLDDENNLGFPLRIKYGETKPKEIENLNLYYQNGELIFGELVATKINKRSKPIKENREKYYFEKGELLDNYDIDVSNITYILDKHKMLLKSIYD